MKSMILAAGLGIRLRPYTHHTPKPLFPVGGEPILDRTIGLLVNAGCTEVLVNTHHLHRRIDAHIASRNYPVPVRTVHEPDILGTGGALANVKRFWETEPLLVINADVVTDLELTRMLAHHRQHAAAATLVVVDDDRFNSVRVGPDGRIIDFNGDNGDPLPGGQTCVTFTGIQIIEPEFLTHVPQEPVFSSIDVYRRMIRAGLSIHAYMPADIQWIDTGTPERYRHAVLAETIPEAFDMAFGARVHVSDVQMLPLQGDGSDRRWYRLRHHDHRMVMVDHGVRETEIGTTEADAFTRIGRHLYRNGVPVPQILAANRFAGIVAMEDAGDNHLQTFIRQASDTDTSTRMYRQIIDRWLHMAVHAAVEFDDRWAWQTAAYDREVILNQECRYFVDAFLNTVHGLGVQYDTLAPEFELLADAALANAIDGFMHRDFQSRNIMVCGSDIRIIDYQGGRRGPIQYDLASLLVDPYVALPPSMQRTLLDYAAATAESSYGFEPAQLVSGYRWLSVCRLLQALGAFGHLSRNRGKAHFASYIPDAVRSLARRLEELPPPALPLLSGIVADVARQYENRS